MQDSNKLNLPKTQQDLDKIFSDTILEIFIKDNS